MTMRVSIKDSTWMDPATSVIKRISSIMIIWYLFVELASLCIWSLILLRMLSTFTKPYKDSFKTYINGKSKGGLDSMNTKSEERISLNLESPNGLMK
jgi:hypothetical protein